MRQIGTLTNPHHAKVLSDYFYVQNIDHSVEPENGIWQVWIHDDNELDRAEKIFQEFKHSPAIFEASHFRTQARDLRRLELEQAKQRQKQNIDVRTQWRSWQSKTPALTLALIIISVLVSLFSSLGSKTENINFLFIGSREQIITEKFQDLSAEMSDAELEKIARGKGLAGFWSPKYLHQIQQGEIWRLITPIFIHFGILHLVFNMMWLKDLGSIIEGKQGWWYLGLLVLVTAVTSNFGQYLVSGPSFGGMSGVVYGLLGYLWIRGKFDPNAHVVLNPTVVIWMIGWFFLCLTGLMGNVANTAHGVGLVVGMLWGYISSGHWRRVLR